MTRRQWMWLWLWLLLFLIIFCVWNKIQIIKQQEVSTPAVMPPTQLTATTEAKQAESNVITKDISVKLVKEDGKIKLSGVFPSEKRLATILEEMKNRGLKVQRGTIIIDKKADNPKLLAALPVLAEKLNSFDKGVLTYHEETVTMTGKTGEQLLSDELEAIARELNPKYTIDNRVEITAPQIVPQPEEMAQEKSETTSQEVQTTQTTQPETAETPSGKAETPSEKNTKTKKPTTSQPQSSKSEQKEVQKALNAALRNKRVEFLYAKDQLTPKSKKIIDQIAVILKKHPGIKVEIAGHTDSDGTAERNLKLSQRRAEAVKRYLIKKGIPAERLVAKGYGESRPLVKNDTPAHKQLNRRVEFKVIQ